MQTEFSRRVLRPVGFAVMVILVAVAGVFVGRTLRTHGPSETTVEAGIPTTLLAAGDAFPDVVVADEDGGAQRTSDLLATGGVVLFLDLECEPCQTAAERWQRYADEGVVPPDRIFGITVGSRDAVREFKERHVLSFPLLRDSLRVFHDRYDVARFPLQVVVGASGVMRDVTYDTVSPVDPGELERELSE